MSYWWGKIGEPSQSSAPLITTVITPEVADLCRRYQQVMERVRNCDAALQAARTAKDQAWRAYQEAMDDARKARAVLLTSVGGHGWGGEE